MKNNFSPMRVLIACWLYMLQTVLLNRSNTVFIFTNWSSGTGSAGFAFLVEWKYYEMRKKLFPFMCD